MPPLKSCSPANEFLRYDDAQANAMLSNTASERRPYTRPQYAQKVLANLNQLRQDCKFCDVEIVAGGVSLAAHRAVLSASSEYFEAMFRPENGLSERKQKSVILRSIDPEILKALLDFIYTGRIHITQTNVQELLAAADMLQLHEVVDGCCEFLCRELHATNALGIMRFAEAHNCKELTESAYNFINSNFPAVALEDEFLDTPQTLLSKLLKSEYLRLDNESQVLQAALRWIKHDIKQRRCFVFEILQHVRLALLPVRLIDEAIKDCHDVSLGVALRSMRQDISSKRGQLVPLSVRPRASAKKSIYIIGGSRRERTSCGWDPADCIYESVAKFDTFRQDWSEITPMEIGRILPGVAVLNGKIYVVGGERGSQILANGEVYDPLNNTWQTIAPMTVPRCEFGLCTVGGTLYAVGGWVCDDIGGTIECYDPIKNSWTFVGDMPEPRFSMGVVSYDGLIYIVGGCTSTSRYLTDLICYNPVTQEWSSLASMQTARCQMGVAVLGKHLYVVGGTSSNHDVLRTVECYSFDDDKWTMITPMSVNRAIPAVASANGLLYVAGGDQTCEVNFYRAQVTISSVESYDPETDTWKHCPDLPMSRSEAVAVVV